MNTTNKSNIVWSTRLDRTRLYLYFIVLISVSAAGCSAALNQTMPIVRGVTSEAPDGDSIKAQTKLFKAQYHREWEFNNGDKSVPPRFGVSLSGGGIRSASYTIGVLGALQEISGDNGPVLDDVDIFSSVSGGGYAVSWLYAQQYFAGGKLEEELFKPEGDYQRWLESNANFINYVGVSPYFAANILIGIPWNAFANGIFGWHLNTIMTRHYYEKRIKEVFVSPPAGLHESRSESSIQITDLAGFIKTEKLPFFVMNATVSIDGKSIVDSTLTNSVFEFTPIRCGSLAYVDYADPDSYATPDNQYSSCPFSLARAAAISGAALDSESAVQGASETFFSSAVNFDLGFYYDNPDITPKMKGAWDSLYYFRPFPLYYGSRYAQAKSGIRTRLADGGHIENLGAFSLVRRMVGKILIVDAEHDPFYEFGAYWKLKRHLQLEQGVDLIISEIECISPDAVTNEFRDRSQCSPESSTLNKESGTRAAEVGRNPLMRGSVGRFLHSGMELPETIEVIYLKLSVNTKNADSAYRSILAYHEKTKADDPDNFFPMQSTNNQKYSPEQFRAYRDLGYQTLMSRQAELLEWLRD